MNYQKFFGRKSSQVAKDLLGRIILRDTEKGSIAAKIIQTGAYEGGDPKPSREGMKYAPGKIFLMPYRSTYLLNITTDKEGVPSCVEIREVEFNNKTLKGSGKIATALKISSNLEGKLLGKEVQIIGEPINNSKISKLIDGCSDNCLGYYTYR